MLRAVSIILAAVLSAATVCAEGPSVSFSSTYTHLSRECKWAYDESELAEGQDNALVCSGPGKYQIFIYFSATDSYLSIRLKNEPDATIFDPAIGGIDEKKGVVEWRMANGAPFAVIVRSRESTDGDGSGKHKKESLVVRGFDRYSGISGMFDVRKYKNANEAAKKLADDAYRKIQQKTVR